MSAETTLARRLSGATVVVLGDIVADEYVLGETERVSREAPVLVVRWESSEVRLGGAANVAANVAALGAKARPVGVVGDDAAGRGLLAAYAQAGADSAGVVTLRGRCTETKTRILAGGRSTTRQQMLRLDRMDESPLSPARRRRLLQAFDRAVRGADAVVVSDYGAGLIDEPLLERLRQVARRMPVLADSRYGLERFAGLTVVKPNEPELEAAAGHRLRNQQEIDAAAEALRRKLSVSALVVTRGRHGMSVYRDGRRDHVPVHGAAEAVDVTGAGDTVVATLACALGVGADVLEAARVANVAGSVVVQKPGTATCSTAELVHAVLHPQPQPVAMRRGR